MKKFNLLKFKTCNSTNDLLIDYIKDGANEGLSIFSFNQLKGRGTSNKIWVSEYGNIHLSILLKPKMNKKVWYQLSMIICLSVFDTLVELGVSKHNLRIKWPNDILLHSKKVCGILIEAIDKYIVVGIGLNVEFSPELRNEDYKATNIKNNLSNKTFNLLSITEKILNRISLNYEEWKLSAFKSFYSKINHYLAFINEEILFRINNKSEKCIFLGLNEYGESEILFKKKRIKVFSKDSLIFNMEFMDVIGY